MQNRFIDDAVHWRTRAESTRRLAEQMHESAQKQEILRIARDYERRARRAEGQFIVKEEEDSRP